MINPAERIEGKPRVVHAWSGVAFAGLAEYLAHPGVGWWYLFPLSFAPLLLLFHRSRPLHAGIAFGVAAWLAWMLALAWLPSAFSTFDRSATGVVPGLALLFCASAGQAVPYALGAAASVWLRGFGLRPLVLFPLTMSLAEALTPTLVPYSHAVLLMDVRGGPAFCAYAGVHLASLAVWSTPALLAAGTSDLLDRRLTRGLLKASAVNLVVGVSLLAEFASHTSDNPTRMRIAILQSDFELTEKRDHPERVIDWHLNQTKYLLRKETVDLVVWGETVITRPLTMSRLTPMLLGEEMPPVLLGVVSVEQGCSTCPKYNSALLSKACGKKCRYDKQVLVPLFEYLPEVIRSWAPRAGSLAEFAPGPMADVLTLNDRKLGVTICYEGMFGQRLRQHHEQEATLDINVTSDRWVGSVEAQRAHESLSRLAAVAEDLPLVRLVDGGPSGVWNGKGEKVGGVRRGFSGAVVFEVPLD